MSHAGPTHADALLAFIKQEIADGRQFPTHAQMRDEIGESNYANAIMALVLKGVIIRKPTKIHRPKYTYELAETANV